TLLLPAQEFDRAVCTTFRFAGRRRIADFDITHNRFDRWILFTALVAVGGLIRSLFVPRSRVWVRVRETADGAVLEVAGLARSDDPSLEGDVHALASSLAQAQDGTRDGPHGPHQDRPARAGEHFPEGSAQ